MLLDAAESKLTCIILNIIFNTYNILLNLRNVIHVLIHEIYNNVIYKYLIIFSLNSYH